MRYTLPALAVVTSVGLGFAGVTAAQTATAEAPTIAVGNRMFVHGEMPAVVGKVTAVSGNTIAVESRKLMDESATGTMYTVDASSAKVLKGGTPGTAPTASSVSAIVVGDMVAVRGTLSGTNVSATEIMDGPMLFRGFRGGHAPGVMGTVTAVSGNTVTLTGEGGATYTIDASNATIDKISTITAAQIAVGDRLGVHGTVSGTSVTAAHIIDGLPAQAGMPMHDEITLSN